MKKIVFAMLLGAVLGALDGATAWFTPAVRDAGMVATIMMYSSLKSVVAGLLHGVFGNYNKKELAVALFGFAVGLLLAYLVAMAPDPNTGQHYYLQIMIPGALVGLIVGYATARYGKRAVTA